MNKSVYIIFGLLCQLCYLPLAGQTQHANPELLKKSWPAYWIGHPEKSPTPFELLQFTKELFISQLPKQLKVHVSADSRYRFYVNGKWLSHGPSAGDNRHWHYETIDIAPYLKLGKNILAAEVWNAEQERAMTHISFETGFILQQDDLKNDLGINTDTTWRVHRSEAHSSRPEWSRGTDIGPAEWVDFNKHEERWLQGVHTSTGWKTPNRQSHGDTKWTIHYRPGRFLTPRTIPQMRLDSMRIGSIRKADGIIAEENALTNKEIIRVPANTKISLLIDQKKLINAYPNITVQGGKDAQVNLVYAEALYDQNRRKGYRDSIEGKTLRGYQDGFIASGNPVQFMPLWYRTFRYLKVNIETKNEPLEITDFYAITSEYPFDLKANFSSESEFLDSVLQTGWRTAKLCAMETYMDCPYYERLQYIGDTRIQGLISLYNSGDDRLLRQALEQFDQSRMSEGITLSRYPTKLDQQIPTFSLWWIGMVQDYWLYRGDKRFIESFLPGIRQVLSFYQNFQQEDGSLGAMPYWNFTDWSNSPGWHFGAAPNATTGNSSLLDLQLLWAYQVASQLESDLGNKSLSAEYTALAKQLKATILEKYWSQDRQLFADDSDHQYFSQHANVLAILTDVIDPNSMGTLANKILADKSIAQTTIYFRYYQMLALQKAGLGNEYLNQLGVWRDHLNAGLTTWAEISDVETTRSDCHAWGASPNIELYRIVLGINTAAPGFSKVCIAPSLGNLKQAAGRIPHPNGELAVDYKLDGKIWQIEVMLPTGVEGEFIWNGKKYPLKKGTTTTLRI